MTSVRRMRVVPALLVISLAACRTAAAPTEVPQPAAPAPAVAPAPAPAAEAEAEAGPQDPDAREAEAQFEAEPVPVAPRPFAGRVHAFLDTAAVRKSAYAVGTLALIDDFPFFLFQDGGLDPIRDVEYLHVSGPPQGFGGIEVAVRHGIARDNLKPAYERAMAPFGCGVRWSQDGGVTVGENEPTGAAAHGVIAGFELVLPDKRHAVFTESRTTAGAAVDRLEAFRKQRRDVALALEIEGITGSVRRLDDSRIRMPRRLTLEVDAGKSPHPEVRAEFHDRADAEAAVEWLLHDVKEMIDARPELRFTIGSLYRSAKIDREGDTVKVSVRLTAEQANLLLDVTEGFLEIATGRDASRDARRRTLRQTSPPR